MGRVRFTSHIKEWTAKTERNADIAVLEMVTDVNRVAKVIAPKDTHALENSGRIQRKASAHYLVIFGGGSVPYARLRHYRNKKTPSSLRYLERAGEAVERNIKRYTKDL